MIEESEFGTRRLFRSLFFLLETEDQRSTFNPARSPQLCSAVDSDRKSAK